MKKRIVFFAILVVLFVSSLSVFAYSSPFPTLDDGNNYTQDGPPFPIGDSYFSISPIFPISDN